MTGRVLIIAEAGVNHDGDLARALDLVDAAAEAGADVVKFQTFRADRLARADAPKAAYQERTTGAAESQHAMLKRLELSEDDHAALIDRCAARGIRFLSSPFDGESLALLTGRFGLDTLKLGSGELTNGPLLLAAARSGAKVILSTGMATLDEVRTALGVLAYGIVGRGTPAGLDACHAALCTEEGQGGVMERVTLMHCTTEYPAAVEDTNLAAMGTLRRAFGLPVGYSDHTDGDAVTLAAVALGAVAIEKHMTLDRTLPGPDHRASVEPDAFAAMVRGIRTVEAAIGDGVKRPSGPEIANRAVARKSLYAARDLPAGHVLTEADVAVMRPGTGRAPNELWDLLGKPLPAAVKTGDPL